MPPTLKKLRGHVALGLPIHESVKNMPGFLNFINGFLIKNITD